MNALDALYAYLSHITGCGAFDGFSPQTVCRVIDAECGGVDRLVMRNTFMDAAISRGMGGREMREMGCLPDGRLRISAEEVPGNS